MAQTAIKVAKNVTSSLANVVTQSPQLAKSAVQNAQLTKFWNNAKVELAFPGPSEWPAVQKGFNKVLKSAQTGAFANLTVKEAAKNTLVFVEVVTLFYLGEIIGRGSVIGYNV